MLFEIIIISNIIVIIFFLLATRIARQQLLRHISTKIQFHCYIYRWNINQSFINQT